MTSAATKEVKADAVNTSPVNNVKAATTSTTTTKETVDGTEKTPVNSSADVKKNDAVKQDEKAATSFKTNTEEKANETSTKTASNDNKAELKGQIKDIVKESGVDTSKLTNDQINELNKINFSKEAKSGTQLTYSDFKKIAKTLIEQDARYAIPFFNASKIKNMPAAKTMDAQTGKVEDLEIWDSWPVQDAKTGYVSNWNGYQLVVGMMGVPNTNDNHIYLL